jgi:hypothetical protein
MRRAPRASVAVHPVSRIGAPTFLVALSVFVLVPGFSRSAAQAQTCGGNETVLVEFGSSMTYRANLAPDDDLTLIELGSTTRYLANVADPGIGMSWTAESFDDSGWSTGTYGVGYDIGAPPNALGLIQTTVATHAFSVFTRMTLELADASTVNGLFLGADYDDGFAAWVNGVEVFRSAELPGGSLAWNTNAALHESSNATVPNYGTLHDISFVIPYLHPGTNVVAIGVWNSAAATSTDLVLVPKLSMAPNWTLSGFTPSSAWLAGRYGVGYETNTTVGAQNLLLTTVPDHTVSVFTRSTFTVLDKSAVSKLFLGADYDDGFVAWINGVEVFGSNEVPPGLLAWNTSTAFHESSNGTTPDYGVLRDISARGIPALVDGDNVLAVGIWNRMTAQDSTDLVLVPRLSVGEDDPCDGVDNDCDGVVDEDFPDFDADGRKDCVDPDDDNDGIADTFDCAPLDPLFAAPPVLEVRSLLWTRGPVRNLILTWQDQGSGVVYDLAGGLVSQLRPDGGVSTATCLPGGDNLAAPLYDDARPAPPAGDGYYYIVRSQKPPSCGTSSYGLASSGAERQPASACP